MSEASRIDEAKQIIREASKKIECECYLASQDHFFSGGRWSKINLWLGIPSTLLAGITSVTAFSTLAGPHKDVIAGALALVVAALTALSTFLNPKDRANLHQTAWAKYDSIRNKARLLSDVNFSLKDLNLDDDTKALVQQLKDLTTELIELNQSSPQIPRGIFIKVRKNTDIDELVKPVPLGNIKA